MISQQSLRAIALVDLDAFYTQVEALRNPALQHGVPLAVVQYNPFGDLASHTPDETRIANDSNGSLIAVSYAARAHGVKRYAPPGSHCTHTQTKHTRISQQHARG